MSARDDDLRRLHVGARRAGNDRPKEHGSRGPSPLEQLVWYEELARSTYETGLEPARPEFS